MILLFKKCSNPDCSNPLINEFGELPIKEFYIDNHQKSGFKCRCKLCLDNYYYQNKQTISNKCKKYREKNKEKIAQNKKQYHIINKEKIQAKVSRWRKQNPGRKTKWNQQNKDHIRKYDINRYKNNIQAKLRTVLRQRLRTAIKINSKIGSAVSDLGCSITELKIYLESKFYPNPITGESMTWNNWGIAGNGNWQIDHIEALQHANLTNRKDFLRVFNFKKPTTSLA